jgi:N-acetyl-alpha-D-glucosaminyl L-malate synthase BshA
MSLRVGVLCHRGVGGSVRVAVELAKELAARGHGVHLFARTIPLGTNGFTRGVLFHPLRAGDGHAPASSRQDVDWSAGDLDTLAGRIVSVGRGTGLDVLHFHYAVPFASVAGEVRRRLGTTAPAIVGTLHGTDVSVYGRTAGGPTLRSALAEADALTTVSRSHVLLAEEAFQLPRSPELIPNFVDVRRFRPAEQGETPRTHGRPRIVHVSNFRAVKDPVTVARVFLLVRRHVDAELWLVGNGEAMPQVRSVVATAEVSNRVRFFGLHPSVESILPQTDVLLLTSRTESFCLAALEAAASGVPTVAPCVGGLPEVVAHGRTGVLFEPGDEEGAAAAIVAILRDRSVRARMSGGAIERARRFSSDAVVPRYERLYQRLVDERPGHGRPGRGGRRSTRTAGG